MVSPTRKRYLFDDFSLEPDSLLLRRNSQPVHLTKRPFGVLLYLVENCDRVVSRNELLEHFWGNKSVYDDALRKTVGAIRKALDDHSNQPRFIETHWASGYRFIGDLKEELIHAAPAVIDFEQSHEVKIIKEGIEDEPSSLQASPPSTMNDATLSSNQTRPPAKARLSRRALLLTTSFCVLLAVVAIAAAFHFGRNRSANDAPAATTIAPARSIAVMPLKNLTGDAGKDFLSDGITEGLITQLSKTENLKVISRSSVFVFKDKEIDPREIGRRLGVEAILEGSVRQNKNDVWLDVRLVSTSDGHVLWAGDRHKRELREIFDIQDEISCRVATNLQLLLCGKDADIAKHYTNDAEAYEAYLNGRFHWYKRTEDDMRQALAFFNEAIKKDPNYALAYLGLAETYAVMQINRQVPPNSVVSQVKENARKALQVDPKLARAYTIQAFVGGFVEWNWAESERLFNQALALDPNDSYTHGWHGNTLLAQGRFDEAEAELKRAQELDPLKESIANSLGEVYCYRQHADRCAEQAQKIFDTFGQTGGAYRLRAWANREKGDYAAAIADLEMIPTDRTNAGLGCADCLLLMGGQKNRQAAHERMETAIKAGVYKNAPFAVARFYARSGDVEKTFAWLQKAFDERDSDIVSLKIDAAFAPLRADARYQKILRDINLAE